ncbi:MAG: helix-turn-helix domain-containing protein, partial [Deltaproteobacteria bacterium]|nr:helix-turn-helix domain-containing protein [Deltaproteobacteria bacterium]
MRENKKNTYSVPAVDGMLDIVEFLAQHQSHCGITELSRELGLSNNLVFRIMRCLEERRYAERDVSTGAYRLSSGFFTLGMKLYSRFELRRISRKHLEVLSDSLGETTQL